MRIKHSNILLQKCRCKTDYSLYKHVTDSYKSTEKAVVKQLFDHCDENAPLPSNQSAYRKNHATETALLKVQNDILLSMDKQEVVLLVLLDLSSAFDTIDHQFMLDTLEFDFGVTGKALLWIKSFLSDRKQRVYVKNESLYLLLITDLFILVMTEN